MDDLIELGGKIQLSGFKDLDRSSMVILKKIVGNYARKFSGTCRNFEALQLHLKAIHGSKFELHGKVIDNGTPHSSEVTDRNLFFVLDKTLKKLENSLNH